MVQKYFLLLKTTKDDSILCKKYIDTINNNDFKGLYDDSGLDIYIPKKNDPLLYFKEQYENNAIYIKPYKIPLGIHGALYSVKSDVLFDQMSSTVFIELLEKIKEQTIHSEQEFLDYFKKIDDTYLVPSMYYIYPRSSISKTPWRLANNVGVIDKGYRGELITYIDMNYNTYVNYDKYIKDNDKSNDLLIQQYSRLFQICTPNGDKIDHVVFVDEMINTKRNSCGFGSTGK